MPSNKTFATAILCFAVVVTVWLFIKKTPVSLYTQDNNISSVSGSYNKINAGANDDWKKMLTTVDTKTEIATSLTTNSDENFDETTLTGQLARDFMSQYLLLKKNGGEITANDTTNIANSIVSSPNYTSISGAVYISSNLHVTTKTDTQTVRTYRDTINSILKTRSMQVTTGPLAAFTNVAENPNSSAATKLASIVSAAKGLVEDLLKVEVPKDAVNVHLGLLNASSNVLADLEAMGAVSSDPVRSLAGLSQYNQDMLDFQNSLGNINSYFVRKVGAAQ